MTADGGGTDPVYQGSLCWTVIGAAGESCVFGSVHQLDSRRIGLPLEELEQILDDTGVLRIEVDAEGIDEATVTRESLMPSPGDPGDPAQEAAAGGVKQALDDGYLRRLADILRRTDTGREMLPMIGMLPMPFVSLVAATAVQQTSELFDEGDFETERHFIAYAERQGYPVTAVETFEEQMSLITQGSPESDQAKELENIIDSADAPDRIDMYRRYADQDLRLLPEKDMRAPEMAERNALMGERLAAMLAERRMLVIIGAAHLPYDTGVLAELERRGLAVEARPIEVEVHYN